MRQQFLIRPDHRDADVERMAAFARQCLPGKRLRVTVEEWQDTRTSPQNRALFWAYKILGQHLGYTAEELHTVFCGQFFGWTEYEVMGEMRKKPRRSTTINEDGKRGVLGTKEFSEFFEMVQRRAAELGVFIPDPRADRHLYRD